MTLDWSTVATPAGPLTLVVDDDVVVAAGFSDDASLLQQRLAHALAGAYLRHRPDLGPITRAVGAYLRGDLTALDALPARQHGGAFMQAAWAALREIPAGESVSYTQLATRAGRPAAVRAAASACARNLIAPIVPCHRVVRTDGLLGGYYWGLPVKRWLLEHEAAHAAAA